MAQPRSFARHQTTQDPRNPLLDGCRDRNFEQHWPIGTKQRLAFALMLYTGQRRSDVHRMTWADVSEGQFGWCSKRPEAS